MFRFLTIAGGCALILASGVVASAQTAKIPVQSTQPVASYATVAALVLGAPLVIDARIRSASALKPEDLPGLASGRARLLVEADVLALICGGASLPAQISFLADVPLDGRGKPAKLAKQRLLLFARPIADHPDQVQLTGLDSQRGWSIPLDAQVRGIVREVLATDAPPKVTGIGNAFHVAGSLPGEGETQIFLATEAAPVSIQVLRRPGEQPRWSVSLGDIVDELAGAPPKDSLLWYRLACGLPHELPDAAVQGQDPDNARAARTDYALVLRELGPCS